MVGPDPAEAARLLGSLRGVEEVVDEGRLGIHQQFVVRCEEDLREDVGALAQARGWALRELSWRQPTLEQLFARIALGIEGEQEAAADALQPAPESAPGGGLLNLGGPAPAPAEPQPERAVYNLNPFDQGGSRDLGAVSYTHLTLPTIYSV